MAQVYRLTRARRLVNVVIRRLALLGLAGRHTYLLTVPGRSTGRLYSTPVILVENGERWLVAPYGDVGWVRNARAAGEVTLRRGRQTETLKIEEISPAVAATRALGVRPARPGHATVLRCRRQIAARGIRGRSSTPPRISDLAASLARTLRSRLGGRRRTG